jgi:hypothetical protein
MSYAASGMVIQDQRLVPVGVFMVKIAASEHLMRVTGEGFLELVGTR